MSIRHYFLSMDNFLDMQKKICRKLKLKYYKYAHNYIHGKINKLDFKDISFFDLSHVQINDIDDISNIVEIANKYLEGIFDILGSGELFLGDIDWHKDYISGYKWKPNIFFLNYIQESINSSSDVKYPRELSRSHQLLHCAEAFIITKDNKYAEYVVSQIDSWIDENPLMYSINWGCAMDVAIRAVNWIWALSLIQDYLIEKESFFNKVKVSLYEHGWFVYRNPEKTSPCSHNHYLADLSGQIHLGLLFRNTPEGEKWLNEGIKELYSEIRYQILPCGMSYERSTHYNRLVLELIVVPILLLKQHNYEIPQDIWSRLESMFDYIKCILPEDGNMPIIGDQDNGRLLPFGTKELNDFRYLLSIGALLFNRNDFKEFSNGYNVYCNLLIPSCTKQSFEAIKGTCSERESKAFPDAGFFVMRSKNDYLLFNVSGKGLYPEICSTTHTHSDLLSIEIISNGESFICDCGSYVYTANAEQRAYFRSTAMHNTATIDNLSQNIITKENLWDFERNAIPFVTTWNSTNEYDYIEAYHTGYLRLQSPVIHKRNVLYNKIDRNWVITDFFEMSDKHTVDIHYHFAPEVVLKKDNLVVLIKGIRNQLSMEFECDNEYNILIEDSFISRSYGKMISNKKIRINITNDRNFKIITYIKRK